MAAAAPASLRALAARGSSAQCGSSAPLLAPAQRTARRRVAAPARAGLFDGMFGKPPAKPAKPGGKPGGMKPILGSCSNCKNTGGVACKGCKGTGKNKANGNPFERFKCYDCQARARLRSVSLTRSREYYTSSARSRSCAPPHAPPLSDSASALAYLTFWLPMRALQGFGNVPCKACGRGGRGLTPEQTGER